VVLETQTLVENKTSVYVPSPNNLSQHLHWYGNVPGLATVMRTPYGQRPFRNL